MARLKYYNANTNEWIYADLAVQAPGTGLPDAPTTDGDYVLSLEVDDGDNTYTWETPSSGGGAGITYDVTIAGTATGDITDATNWTSATYTAKSSVADMLTKIRATGKIDFDGGLTKSTTSALGVPVTQYYLPIIQWCEIMSAEYFAALAQSQSLTSDGTTEGIIIHAAGLNASGEYGHQFMLVIGVLQGGTTICIAI